MLPAGFGQPAPPASPSPSLEMPVLFTDHQHRPVGDFRLDQIKIKTGTADAISPTAMRKEGTDPLSLAIVLDASRDTFHDLHQVGDDFESIAGASFLPADRVSVYALDCQMTRSLTNAPVDAAVLKKAVADALAYPTLHDGRSGSACQKTNHLWDRTAAAIAQLAHAPGRRVVLLLTSGADGGSKYDWQTVQQYAFDQGVAIFALRDQRQADADTYTVTALSTQRGTGAGNKLSPTPAARNATELDLLCANAGGLTLNANTFFRKDALADILFLVRSRFILTIPRASYPAGSAHMAKVTLSILMPFFSSATGALDPLPPAR